jgi:hypothetical protein
LLMCGARLLVVVIGGKDLEARTLQPEARPAGAAEEVDGSHAATRRRV